MVQETARTVVIHMQRLGKPERVFSEGFLHDNGSRLSTLSQVPEAYREKFSQGFQQQGLIPAGKTIYSVAKHHFYQEYFGVMQLYDSHDRLLGYYCDLLTPMVYRQGEYHLTDLFVDIWVNPDGSFVELDWDEYAQAVRDGLLSSTLQTRLESTVARLRSEIAEGKFPHDYLPSP